MANQYRPGVPIIVAKIEFGHFCSPDAGGIEQFKNGAVAQSHGVGGVWQRELAVDFFRTERLGKAAGTLRTLTLTLSQREREVAGEVQIGGGVGWNDASATELGEKASDGAKPSELGIGYQGDFALVQVAGNIPPGG
jgi:hypothetical protein